MIGIYCAICGYENTLDEVEAYRKGYDKGKEGLEAELGDFSRKCAVVDFEMGFKSGYTKAKAEYAKAKAEYEALLDR